MTIVGNNKVFSDTIQNYSGNPYRRVELTATINHSVDHRVAIRLLKERLARIPNVLTTPAPVVEILQLTPAGPQLCVRPFCNNQHYWQVYFDTNRVIRETFGEAGFPVPIPGYAVTGLASSPLAAGRWSSHLPCPAGIDPLESRVAPHVLAEVSGDSGTHRR